MSTYVLIDGVIQKRTPELERWTRRASTHVPNSKTLTENTEAPAVPVLDPERRADNRAQRTAYRVLETLDEVEQ